jgi:hypothetical protein
MMLQRLAGLAAAATALLAPALAPAQDPPPATTVIVVTTPPAPPADPADPAPAPAAPTPPPAAAPSPAAPGPSPAAPGPRAPSPIATATAPDPPSDFAPATPHPIVSKVPPASAVLAHPHVARAGRRRDKSVVGNGPIAFYPGFRMLGDGNSQVMVELSRKVEVTEHKAEGRLTYRLHGASVPTHTNRLPLMTGFFATPVARVQLVEDGGDADLVIELRVPADAGYKVVDTATGIVLQVDFLPLGSPLSGTSSATDVKPVTDAALPSGEPEATDPKPDRPQKTGRGHRQH